MAKNPNSKAKKPVKRDGPMTGPMKVFVLGCIAELYLLIVRRCYVNGYAEQQIAWYDVYLKNLILAGVAVLAVGGVLSYLWRKDTKKRFYGWGIAGLGAFLALSSGLVLWNMSTLTFLTTLVPVLLVLCVVWGLYDRECALSLSLLGVSLLMLWVCRRQLNSLYLGTLVKVAVVVLILALVLVAVLVKQGKLTCLLPAKAEPTSVYVACGLSAVALAVSLLGTTVAYYAMWALAIVVFGLAVYYTVKQL